MKISSLFDRYCFCQAVAIPTHKLCHILDCVMSRPADSIVCSTTVSKLISSEYCCVVCDLSVIIPVNNAELKQSRNVHGIDLKTFKSDIFQLISPTL